MWHLTCFQSKETALELKLFTLRQKEDRRTTTPCTTDVTLVPVGTEEIGNPRGAQHAVLPPEASCVAMQNTHLLFLIFLPIQWCTHHFFLKLSYYTPRSLIDCW